MFSLYRLLSFAVLSLVLLAAASARQPRGTEESAAAGEAMSITITIDNGKSAVTLSATLADNKSAAAFAELLKKGAVTVAMHGYGGFEQVGTLPRSLPRGDTQITTVPGDIMLYQGNQVVMFYGTNAWAYTRLGKITGKTQDELKAILGSGDVTAVFALAD